MVIDPTKLIVEKDVAMPWCTARVGQSKSTWTALFDTMNVGDSFIAPSAARGAISSAIQDYRRQVGNPKKNFATRAVRENGEKWVRTWRIL